MKKTKLPIGNVLLCDYVGRGEGNKFVLIGSYSGDLIVPNFPAIMMLGLYSEIIVKETEQMEVVYTINYNKDRISDLVIKLANVQAGPQVIVLGSFPLNVREEGTLSIVATSELYKDTIVLEKSIRFGTITPGTATASLPPSEQSPPDAPAS